MIQHTRYLVYNKGRRIACRIRPGRIEGAVPGLSSGSVEFSQASLGGRRWSPGASLGVFGGRILGGGWVVPGRPRGLLGEGPGGTGNTEGFFNVSWGFQGSPEVIFVVWGGPGDRPGKWTC